MARYYTKETLRTKVKQLEEATGFKIKLLSCNGMYALQYEDGPEFPGAGWYRTVKWLIIYADGFLAGMKFSKEQ